MHVKKSRSIIKRGVSQVNAREVNHAAGYTIVEFTRGRPARPLGQRAGSVQKKMSVYCGLATEAAVEPGRTMSPPAAAMKRAAVVAKPLIFLHSSARFLARGLSI